MGHTRDCSGSAILRLVEHLPTEDLRLCRQAASLVVIQPERLAFEALLQNPVLLDEVLDDVLLVAVDPARDGHEQGRRSGKQAGTPENERAFNAWTEPHCSAASNGR